MTGPIERILEPPIDEARIAATWKRISDARAPRHRSLPRWTFAIAAAGLAAIALYAAWPAHGGPLASRDRSIAMSPGAVLGAADDRAVQLDDGSSVDLAPGTRLQVLTNESNRFVALLDHGRAHFDVRPGGPRSWQIETSRATVEVVGTAFVVDADDHRLVVEVERGIVIVRGERVPGRVMRLTAGQHIGIEDPIVKTAAAPVVPIAPVVVAPAPAPRPVVADRQPLTVHAAPVQNVPPVAIAPPPSELAAAMTDADTRRAKGDAAGAAAVLETALATARDAESKGMAEFTLGRLYLEQLGQPDRAADTFARMIALGQPLGLLEDAQARRIMALVKAGRRDEASAAFADYDRAYPHGAHHAMVHALFSPRSP